MNAIPIHRPKGPTMNQVPQARMPATPPRAKTAAEEWNEAMAKARKVNQRSRSRIVADFGPDSRQVRDFDGDCERQYRRMRDEFAYSRPAMDDEQLRPLKQAAPTGSNSYMGQARDSVGERVNIYHTARGYVATRHSASPKDKLPMHPAHEHLESLLFIGKLSDYRKVGKGESRPAPKRYEGNAPSVLAQRAADKAVSDIAADLHEFPAAEPEGQRVDPARDRMLTGSPANKDLSREQFDMAVSLGHSQAKPRPWRDAVFFLAGVAVGGGALVALALMNPPAPTTVAVPMAIEEHGPATNIGNGIARTDDWERGISCYAHARGLSCTAMPAEAPAVAATLGKVVL